MIGRHRTAQGWIGMGAEKTLTIERLSDKINDAARFFLQAHHPDKAEGRLGTIDGNPSQEMLENVRRMATRASQIIMDARYTGLAESLS